MAYLPPAAVLFSADEVQRHTCCLHSIQVGFSAPIVTKQVTRHSSHCDMPSVVVSGKQSAIL